MYNLNNPFASDALTTLNKPAGRYCKKKCIFYILNIFFFFCRNIPRFPYLRQDNERTTNFHIQAFEAFGGDRKDLSPNIKKGWATVYDVPIEKATPINILWTEYIDRRKAENTESEYNKFVRAFNDKVAELALNHITKVQRSAIV